MEDNEIIVVTLEFEDGESVECEAIGLFEYAEFPGKTYIALAPTDEEDDDVYIYEYHELSDDEFELLDIEDDNEFDKVAAEFERLVEESVDD